MKEITLPYGPHPLKWKPPHAADVTLLHPNRQPPVADLEGGVAQSLSRPLGMPPLRDCVKPSDRVAVVVSDAARLFPQETIVKLVLREIAHAVPSHVTFVIANGNHERSEPAQVGLGADLQAGYAIVNHDSQDAASLRTVGHFPPKEALFFTKQALKHLSRSVRSVPASLTKIARAALSGDLHSAVRLIGYTPFGRALFVFGASAGARVRVNRAVADANIRILIGQIKPHFLAGFSGGYKAIFPGCAHRIDIAMNHFMMNHPSVDLGRNNGNIIREYIEKAGRFCGKSFAVNVVMNPDRTVAGIFSGDPVEVQRKGSMLCAEIAQVAAPEADVVISAEGFPEAMNLYQFTKVVPPAGRVVKPRGAIICVGSCAGGIGGMTVVNDITCKIGFWHMLPKGVRLYLVSDLPKKAVRETEFRHAATIDEALLREMRLQKKKRLGIAVLCGAGLMIPQKESA